MRLFENVENRKLKEQTLIAMFEKIGEKQKALIEKKQKQINYKEKAIASLEELNKLLSNPPGPPLGLRGYHMFTPQQLDERDAWNWQCATSDFEAKGYEFLANNVKFSEADKEALDVISKYLLGLAEKFENMQPKGKIKIKV
jgi:hypothetical protein